MLRLLSQREQQMEQWLLLKVLIKPADFLISIARVQFGSFEDWMPFLAAIQRNLNFDKNITVASKKDGAELKPNGVLLLLDL